jgi:hypothetical protein
MEKEGGLFPLDSVKFIIRHPWIFISTFVVILSMVFAHLSYIQINYQCKAIISFEATGSGVIDSRFLQRKQDLLKSLLIGENIRNIIQEVWPYIKEDTEPRKYNYLTERLRHPRLGIKILFERSERQGEQEFVTIQFTDTNPKLAYKIVQATIDVLKRASKEKTEEKIESGLTFIRKQMEFYKDKIRGIDEDISRISGEIRKEYPNLTDDERNLLDEKFAAAAFRDGAAKAEKSPSQLLKYDERLMDLKLAAVQLQTRKRGLQNRLNTGNTAPITLSQVDMDSDAFIKQYSQEIVAKELAKTEYMSQGFLPEHPFIKRLHSEIQNLKNLREQRISELTSATTSIENIKKEMKDIDTRLEVVDLERKALEGYNQSEESLKVTATGMSGLSLQAAKLLDLRNEKEVTMRYYNDMRQQLEGAELKSRMEKEEAGIEISIIEEPKVPIEPIPMQKAKTVFMGVIIALAAAAGLAYFVDSLDRSVKSSPELRHLLHIPVLGAIDRINTSYDIKVKKLRRNVMIITLLLFAILSNIIFRVIMGIVMTIKM